MLGAAGFLESGGDERVDGVREPGREVVLHLEVEAAHDPVQGSLAGAGAAVHVNGGVELVLEEVGAPARRIVLREVSDRGAVRELEHDGEHESDHPRDRHVEDQHDPPARGT